MVAELTGNFYMLVPATIASVISYLVSGDDTIYEQQVDSREDSPAHLVDYILALMRHIKAKDAMTTDVTVVSENALLKDIYDIVKRTQHLCLPVVNGEKRFTRIISVFDILSVPLEEWDSKRVSDIRTHAFVYVTPDEPLISVIAKMIKNDLYRIPVIDPKTRKLIGEVAYEDAMKLFYEKVKELELELSRSQK